MSAAGTASPPPPLAGLAARENDAVRHLREALQSGESWHQAMLSAMGLWTLPYEVYEGREFRYLIGGEAFDWLVLAERLCLESDGAVPTEDKERLLFNGQLPPQVTAESFRDLLGANKYRGYLNYWYGIVVEEALQLAVEEDVRKRQIARCYPDSEDLVEEAYSHLYGRTRATLLAEFRRHAGIHHRRRLTLANLKEFTYWLHKRRLEMWDPARVASDTRRGIRKLKQLEQAAGAAAGPAPGPEEFLAQAASPGFSKTRRTGAVAPTGEVVFKDASKTVEPGTGSRLE